DGLYRALAAHGGPSGDVVDRAPGDGTARREPVLTMLCTALRSACVGLAFVVAATTPGLAQPDPPSAVSVPSDEMRFAAFVHDFRDEALKAGIKPETYDRAMSAISLNTKVQDLNLNQPEFVRPVWEYLTSAVSDTRVKKGKDLIGANAELLTRLERDYGVPK